MVCIRPEDKSNNVIETIVALATPPGAGGIGVVRLSGSNLSVMARKIVGQCPAPRLATLAHFKDDKGQAIDRGIALYFPAPNSYTGEDVLELQSHGSLVVANILIARCIQLGARLARPGEFSERAFLNGKLDLIQAEAVADLIHSSSEQAARSAMRSLQGEFSSQVHKLTEAVTHLRIYVEAAIDFPEEEINFLQETKIKQQLDDISDQFSHLMQSVEQGTLLKEGVRIVLTGLPNAGKSSLLNALVERDRAIVSHIPGTTRDTLEQTIWIDGLMIRIIDTAGIRNTQDEIEAEGVRRSKQAQTEADLVIMVVDCTDSKQSKAKLLQSINPDITTLVVHNKIDLMAVVVTQENHVCISAKTGEGLDQLKRSIKQIVGFKDIEESQFIARSRHLAALNKAKISLQQGAVQLNKFQAGELLAEELLACQRALGEITGEVNSDDLLGLIFSSFCIGK